MAQGTAVSDKPKLASVLNALSKERLLDLGRVFGLGLREQRDTRAALAATLAGALREERLPQVLRELGRDELRAVCRGHGLPDGDRHRDALIERLVKAAGLTVLTRPCHPCLVAAQR